MESVSRKAPALYLSVSVPWPLLFYGGVEMEKAILTDEDFNQIFANAEDIKTMLWHIHSLADLLILKYQETVDAGKITDRDEFSTPILSIAEMLVEKSTAAIKNIDEIDEVGMKFFKAGGAA